MLARTVKTHFNKIFFQLFHIRKFFLLITTNYDCDKTVTRRKGNCAPLSVYRYLNIENICLYRSMASSSETNLPSDELKRIVWIDLEMTGLNVDKDHILEVACLITDTDLNIVAEGPNLILHQPEHVLRNMNSWCVEQHGKTGLTEGVLKSTISLLEAEQILLNFVKQHIGKGVSPLAGNSVYMDRLFINRYMPQLDEYLHYRIIDVSTVKELCRRWGPLIYKQAPKKKFEHRALNDIKESVEELKYYRQHIFKI